jgi:hypothetical protein
MHKSLVTCTDFKAVESDATRQGAVAVADVDTGTKLSRVMMNAVD